MSENQTRRRVTYTQLLHLWESLNKHREIAVGYNKSAQAREHSKGMWDKIASLLNSFGEGSVKSGSEWSKYWVDYKAKIKRKNRLINEASRRTGGGPSTDLELSEMDRKFLSLLGEDYGLGLPGIQVDPLVTQEHLDSNRLGTSTSTTDEGPLYLEVDLHEHNQIMWEDDNTEKFMCKVCRKTFYNTTALQNHRKLQHDITEDSSSDPDQYDMSSTKDEIFSGGFQFIPLNNSSEVQTTVQEDGTVLRVFGQDTSYLIVKVDGDDVDIDAVKRRRLGAVKRNRMKPGKQQIDLRGPFTCTFPSTLRPDLQCRQIFFNCCEYSLHYREEHTKRRKAALRCQVCEKPLDKDVAVSPRVRMAAQLALTCRLCHQTFACGSDYDEHNRTTHAKLKPHQCTICAKRFTQQGGLQQHMRMHTGVRPFPCTFCPKAFTQKAGLDQHLRTHTKIKPFKCVICSKCFSQSVHLRQHMRTHTNIQPFECSFCGKRFKQSSHLNFHMRSHAGDSGALVMERYAHSVQPTNHLDFLKLANLQPVDSGQALYYTADLTAGPPQQNPYGYESHQILPANMLSL